MSEETMTWLNTMTLIGFTDQRGNAWHYRAEAQGDEPNHYPGAIPVDDVLRRLFHWTAVEMPLAIPRDLVKNPLTHEESVAIMTGTPEEVQGLLMTTIEGRKAVVRDDTDSVLGIFSEGYKLHQYSEWLLGNVANILDADLGIGSAGLLREGARGWVSVEVPDSITTPEGVVFRPNLLACTSFDGSLATTYKRVITHVVCDNTLACGLGEQGQVFRVKHTRNSDVKLADARAALNVVHQMADDFEAEVAALCATKVSQPQWGKVLDLLVPVPEKPGSGLTKANNKRDALYGLWNHDDRVTPWKNTAFGVLQAFNTYDHHLGSVNKNATRAQRNMGRAVDGTQAKADLGVLEALSKVL